MKISNPFKTLTKFEWILMITSIIVVIVSFIIPTKKDVVGFISSLFGVVSLIFLAKGNVFGQFLCLIFSGLYAVVAFTNKLYGEVIIFACITLPICVGQIVSWIRHPFNNGNEVEVAKTSWKTLLICVAITIGCSIGVYFLLNAFKTELLILSTFSFGFSLLGSFLGFFRSPYFCLVFVFNDITVISMWSMQAYENISLLPTVFCFVMFLLNDIYGVINWKRMEKKQQKLTHSSKED